jgi:hypothetical protein
LDEIKTTIEAFTKLYQLVATSALAAGLMVGGLILIVITGVLAAQIIKSEPKDLSTFMRTAFFACMGFGVLLIIAGPAISWLEVTRGGIRRVPLERSFAHLDENSRATWLLRLISYDPLKEPQLAVSHLTALGPSSQLYTFVASYHELRGYNVRDAVRMMGGTIRSGERVSAVIFPVPPELIPANARGMLQVVSDIQDDYPDKIQKKLDIYQLSDDARKNLSYRQSIPSWGFSAYAFYYPAFCQLSQKFRCESPKYSARNYIGEINDDWNPLGFALRLPSQHSPCEKQMSDNICNISTWNDADKQFEKDFGARAFLVKNLQISDLKDVYLIDFEEPDSQVIPDIGVADPPK